MDSDSYRSVYPSQRKARREVPVEKHEAVRERARGAAENSRHCADCGDGRDEEEKKPVWGYA